MNELGKKTPLEILLQKKNQYVADMAIHAIHSSTSTELSKLQKYACISYFILLLIIIQIIFSSGNDMYIASGYGMLEYPYQ